jgi:hypothetical protein
VDDGVSGFLCEVRNAADLARACFRFLTLSRDERIAQGLAGRKKMEREFDQAHVAAAYRYAVGDALHTAKRAAA